MCFDDNKQANVCVMFAKCAGIHIGPRESVLKVINA